MNVEKIKENIKTEKMEDQEIKKSKNSIFIRGLRGVAYITMSMAAIFWIWEVLANYFSYPVYSTVTLVNNETLTYPSISVCTRHRYYTPCYNETELKMFNASDYEWGKPTYFQIMSKVQYKSLEHLLYECSYMSLKRDDWDCSSSTSGRLCS